MNNISQSSRRCASPSSDSATSPRPRSCRPFGTPARTWSSRLSCPRTAPSCASSVRRYGVERLHSYEEADELFASGDIDAVYIALPNTMHAEWTIRAASAGLHVLCEKPLATSVRDCERMIEACARNGVRLMTAYRLHFERCNLEVASIVRRKRIGDARFFDSQFSMQVKDGNIRVDRELGGGPEWDIGIYCINAARYVFAAEPTQVWATATNSR